MSNEATNPASCQTAVVRSASEIELRLKNLKLDQADCKRWHDDAYAKYESDRKYWGRGEADPAEYLEANRQLVKLNVQIYQLEWVLGLRPQHCAQRSDYLRPTINKTDVISRLTFHVHNDIEEAAKWYKIPIALYSEYDVYIMQEDRCVFVGSSEAAISWMKRNEGKVCPSRFSFINLNRMSKRCKLQKEYYQQYGNYKGNGKYSDEYVSWLEEQILALRIHDVVGRSEQLLQIHGFTRCECGEVYDVGLKVNCPECGN